MSAVLVTTSTGTARLSILSTHYAVNQTTVCPNSTRGLYTSCSWHIANSESIDASWTSKQKQNGELGAFKNTQSQRRCQNILHFYLRHVFEFLMFLFYFYTLFIFKTSENGIHVLQNRKIKWLFCYAKIKRYRPIKVPLHYRIIFISQVLSAYAFRQFGLASCIWVNY